MNPFITKEVNDILKRYTTITLNTVINQYESNGRFYHNFSHLEYMFEKGFYTMGRRLYRHPELILAILFHDYVLDDVNASIVALSNVVRPEFRMDRVVKSTYSLIGVTENHVPNDNPLSELLIKWDLGILSEKFSELMEYEHKIFKEYQKHDYRDYKVGRIKVLNDLQSKHNVDLSQLIAYVEARVPKIGFYAGSFNPFHAGHYNILKKAEDVFDKVVIARGINPDKHPKMWFELPEIVKNRQFITYNGTLYDFIDNLGYPATVIRGIRTGKDVDHDIETMDKYPEMEEIPVAYFVCDKDLNTVSSTQIRKNFMSGF